MTETTIVAATDADFEWMLQSDKSVHRGLRLPPGEIEDRPILEHVRKIAANLRERGCNSTWMMVSDNEVVGLCGYHQPPSAEGDVEIGYNVAPSRQRRGHATRAVAAMLAIAKKDPAIKTVLASTPVDNIASQRVLERNGFARVGERADAEDGRLALWRIGATVDEARPAYDAMPQAANKSTRRATVVVRPAQSQNLDQLLTLFDQVAAERKWIATEPGFDKELYRRTWQGIIDGGGGALFVACDEDEVVGSLSIFVTQSGDHDLGMLVSQERRGQGIGTALVREAIGWARQQNVPVLGLGVFPHNKAAIRLYEKMGFIHMGHREHQMTRQTGETWDVILMQYPIWRDL